MNMFKIKVRYVVKARLEREAWLVGLGDDLSISNIYTTEKDTDSYSLEDLPVIMSHEAYGKAFVITKLVPSND